MAITNTNISYSGQGPSAGGQVFADGVQPGNASSNIDGFGQITLDGAAVTATLGFIDGVQTLPFVPSAVLIQRNVPASDTAAATTTIVVSGAITNAGVPVTISAAGSNGQKLSYALRIIR